MFQLFFDEQFFGEFAAHLFQPAFVHPYVGIKFLPRFLFGEFEPVLPFRQCVPRFA